MNFNQNTNDSPTLQQLCDRYDLRLLPRQPLTRENVILAIEREIRHLHNSPAASSGMHSGDHLEWKQKLAALQTHLHDLRQQSVPPQFPVTNLQLPITNPKPTHKATQQPTQLPTQHPAQAPIHPTQPLPPESSSSSAPSASSAVKNPEKKRYLPNQNHLDADSALGKFRLSIQDFKTAIADLSENGDPKTVKKNLFTLLTSLLTQIGDPEEQDKSASPPSSVPSVRSVVKTSPSDSNPALDEELAEINEYLEEADNPKSPLDHLPPERQQAIYDLLCQKSGRKVHAAITEKWQIKTSVTALQKFKHRYQAKLDAAEQARLQKELNDLSGPNAPNHTQAAEKLLERRLIQVVRDSKSTPEQIQKIVNATTRFINCQTAKARLQFQQNRNAGFQPAVSPVSNRQGPETPER